MRDRTKAASAVLRSEIYRGVRRTTGGGPLGAGTVPQRPDARNGAGAPRPRQGSGAPSHFTALALLGLLDLFKGG